MLILIPLSVEVTNLNFKTFFKTRKFYINKRVLFRGCIFGVGGVLLVLLFGGFGDFVCFSSSSKEVFLPLFSSLWASFTVLTVTHMPPALHV